jgi:long-chain acyl-CoA synthetase
MPDYSQPMARPWEALYPPHWRAFDRVTDALMLFRETVAARGDATAITYFDARLTWHDVDRESDALACWLAARKVVAGDRVVILFQNIPQFVPVVLAIWKIGAIPVPGNPLYREAELARLFADCHPAAVFAQTDQAAVAHAALHSASLDVPLLAASASAYQTRNPALLPEDAPLPACAIDLAAAIAACTGEHPPAVAIDPASTGLIMYTSGTTGTPRGAMMRHDSIAYNSDAFCVLSHVAEVTRLFAAAPFFHITGFICHFGAAIRSGCSLILSYRLLPDVALDVIRDQRPTVTIAAITAYNALMSAPGATRDDFASFEMVSSGGAPVAPALHRELRERTGLEIQVGYGMTETTSPAVFTPDGITIPVHPEHGALSIGIPTPGTDVIIVGDDGEIAPPGQPGELWMRGPQIMTGYWRKREETEAALYQSWMRSGDVAVMDEAGWLYLIDRKKDVIVASGFKVWPREVEDVLYLHPAVREAAVVGAPDAYRGETVHAYVSLKPGHAGDTEAIATHCRERLTGYKQPRRIEILDELPKTITGKIQRVELRKLAAQHVVDN